MHNAINILYGHLGNGQLKEANQERERLRRLVFNPRHKEDNVFLIGYYKVIGVDLA